MLPLVEFGKLSLSSHGFHTGCINITSQQLISETITLSNHFNALMHFVAATDRIFNLGSRKVDCRVPRARPLCACEVETCSDIFFDKLGQGD